MGGIDGDFGIKIWGKSGILHNPIFGRNLRKTDHRLCSKSNGWGYVSGPSGEKERWIAGVKSAIATFGRMAISPCVLSGVDQWLLGEVWLTEDRPGGR